MEKFEYEINGKFISEEEFINMLENDVDDNSSEFNNIKKEYEKSRREYLREYLRDGVLKSYSNYKKFFDSGTIYYYNKYGNLHREDGPAMITCDGGKVWLKNGVQHRLDGPAIIKPDGSKEWWVDDVEYLEEDFLNL